VLTQDGMAWTGYVTRTAKKNPNPPKNAIDIRKPAEGMSSVFRGEENQRDAQQPPQRGQEWLSLRECSNAGRRVSSHTERNQTRSLPFM